LKGSFGKAKALVINMNIQDAYKNKLFSILGDSISTLDGYTEPDGAAFYTGMEKFRADVFTPDDTWWGQVVQYLGGRVLVNNSFSGSTVIKHRSCEIQSFGCSDERTSSLGRSGVDPDVIMVFMGTNDWGCAARLRPVKESNENDLSIFFTAYTAMIEKLQKNYTKAEIWCFTLPISTYKEEADFVFPYLYRGIHINDYCDIIREVAVGHGCRVIDLYNAPNPYDTIDGFHPDQKGMKTLSGAVIQALSQLN